MAPELCTIVVTLMMNFNGMGWKPITKYLNSKELNANVATLVHMSNEEDPSVRIKDVKIVVDLSRPFDCARGPSIRPKK